MNMYTVHGLIDATVRCEVRAATPERARELAEDHLTIQLCHQCSGHMNADNIYDYVVSDCDTGEEVIASARDQAVTRIKELEARVRDLETFNATGSRMLLVHRLVWREMLNRQIKDKERITSLEHDAREMDVAYDTKTRGAEALEAMLKIVTAELNDLRVVHWDCDDLQPEEKEDIDRIEKAINEADALLKVVG